MEILSYPIGLLVGLFPIAASLGPSKAPAHLLLDGRPVCELTERSPGCMVDLGPDPRVHLLELLRTDAAGHVTERVRRWVNRPGIDAEILAAGGCDEAARRCDFELTWAHPLRLDPKRIDISLDGTPVWNGKERRVSVSLGAKARPQILVADAEFPDGTRATYSRTLYASYPEEAQAALQAVPLLPAPGSGTDETLAAALRTAGWPVRTVEETEPEITFVMEMTAFDRVAGFPFEDSRPAGHAPAENRGDHGLGHPGRSRRAQPVAVDVPDRLLPARPPRADHGPHGFVDPPCRRRGRGRIRARKLTEAARRRARPQPVRACERQHVRRAAGTGLPLRGPRASHRLADRAGRSRPGVAGGARHRQRHRAPERVRRARRGRRQAANRVARRRAGPALFRPTGRSRNRSRGTSGAERSRRNASGIRRIRGKGAVARALRGRGARARRRAGRRARLRRDSRGRLPVHRRRPNLGSGGTRASASARAQPRPPPRRDGGALCRDRRRTLPERRRRKPLEGRRGLRGSGSADARGPRRRAGLPRHAGRRRAPERGRREDVSPDDARERRGPLARRGSPRSDGLGSDRERALPKCRPGMELGAGAGRVRHGSRRSRWTRAAGSTPRRPATVCSRARTAARRGARRSSQTPT